MLKKDGLWVCGGRREEREGTRDRGTRKECMKSKRIMFSVSSS